MRGVKSHAMVLCVRIQIFELYYPLMPSQATAKEGKEGGVELIKPPIGSKPGDRVYFEGAEFESTFGAPC